MKILFFSRQPPIPLDNGARMRTHALANELAASSRLHFLSWNTQPGNALARESHEAVAAALPEAEAVELIPRPKREKRRLQVETMLFGRSYGFRTHAHKPMARALLRAIEDFEPDLLHCDDLLLGDLARLAPSSIVRVMALHNIESLLMARMADTTDEQFRRKLYLKEAELQRRWERAHLPEFDLCTCVFSEDANHVTALGANAVCVPNGVDRHQKPSPVRSLGDSEPLKLLFIGSGSWEPNRVGMAWFVEKVLPEINCPVFPQVTIVGAHWDWLDSPHCEIAGHVPSIEEYYESHDVALVPLLAGGGSRLKVAEALAKGVPVVGTTVGLEGYSLEPDVHALFGNTPTQLAEQIQKLDERYRTATEAVDRQVAAGFQLVERFFWDEIGRRMIDNYEDVVAKKRSRGADRVDQRFA